MEHDHVNVDFRARQKMCDAILRVLPEEVPSDSGESAGYFGALLETIVWLSLEIWGREKAPQFLSEHINELLASWDDEDRK